MPPRLLRHQGLHHDHAHDDAPDHRHNHVHGSANRLSGAFFLTALFLVAELATGLVTNSLALVSDAFHMLSDTLALGLGALAARVSLRRPTAEKTYGFKRFEVLAAFTNALLLAVFGVAIAFKAAQRLWMPQEVHAEPMLAVAAFGLLLNLGIFLWLHRGAKREGGHGLNEEGVLWHVAGDALGSIAAIAAGVVMVTTGWMRADAVAGLATASVLLFGSQRVLRLSAHILVEGTPPGVDGAAVRALVEGFPGVRSVHDFHLWSLSGRDLYLSAHLDLVEGEEASIVTSALRGALKARFGAIHVTLQTGPCGPGDCGNDCR